MNLQPLTKLRLVLNEFHQVQEGMPIQMALVLLAVIVEPGINGTELKDRTGLGNASGNRMLYRLSDMPAKVGEPDNLGLITMKDDPLDRRFRVSHPTAKGKKLAERISRILGDA